VTPIAVELCVGGRDLTEPRLSPNGTWIGWVETVQRVSRLLLRSLGDDGRSDVIESPAPRPGRALGGGCWCWTADGNGVVYAAADGNIWLHMVGSEARQLTDVEPRTAQAPCVSPDGAFVVFVVDQVEVWRVALAGGAPERLDVGSADFCFDPAVDPTSTVVVWQGWNVPDMAWDGARIEHLALASRLRSSTVVDGSLQQPRFLPDGRLICVADDRGWANVVIDGRPVVAEDVEHAGPTWGLGQRSIAASPDGRLVAFTRNERGFGRLCIADIATGEVREVARGVHGQLSWQGDRIAALRTGARTPTQVVVHDAHDLSRTVLDVGPPAEWTDAELIEPELVEISADDGATVHARLYCADDSSDRLICWVHGGPTDQWQVTFMPRVAYWRSRGWNVLVPDHRGSTGHGRVYQQALRRRWGELDVTDTLAAVAHAHAHGWGTPATTALFGGSSGGFTVLGALARDDRPGIACGVVSYPVSDLGDLSERSHRFERHYTATLVDPAQYPARSPVTFAHRITVPLLVFHGEDDPVVPVAQSRVLVERMCAAGADVELVVYPGEGHGFRIREHQIDEYRRIEAFLALHMPVRG